VSKATFIKVDTAIFRSLWSWATRRHPKRSGRWVAKQYFRTHNGRQWTFMGTCAGHQGQPYELALFRAGDVPIQRHVKIKGTANPYDPQWEVYFEERLGVKMAHTLKGRRQLLYLWKHQHGPTVVMLGRRKARYLAARFLTRRVAERDYSHSAPEELRVKVSLQAAQAFQTLLAERDGATSNCWLWTCLWQLGCRRTRLSVVSLPPCVRQIT